MQIDKDTVLGFLRQQGEHQKAQEAERELPEKVDHERDSNLLQRLGIDPKDLISKVGGGLGPFGG